MVLWLLYSSDTQIKNLIKECYRKANCNNLKIRWFGESNDDQELWEDGGLTFKFEGKHMVLVMLGFIQKKTIFNEKEIDENLNY